MEKRYVQQIHPNELTTKIYLMWPDSHHRSGLIRKPNTRPNPTKKICLHPYRMSHLWYEVLSGMVQLQCIYQTRKYVHSMAVGTKESTNNSSVSRSITSSASSFLASSLIFFLNYAIHLVKSFKFSSIILVPLSSFPSIP